MKKLLTTILVVVLMAFGSVAGAASIGVNLGSDKMSLSASDVAGVVPQDDWNNAAGSSGSLNNVKNDSGVTTTLDVNWTAPGTWSVTTNGTATGDAKMMNGYIDAQWSDQPAIVTLSEIPYAQYDVYVYFGSNNAGHTGRVILNEGSTPTATYWFTNAANNPGGDGFQAADYLLATTIVDVLPYAAGNYAKFAGLTAGSTTVTVRKGSENEGIFGVQIVEVISEPTYVATVPSPANGVTSVSVTADLSWTAGVSAVSHDVYFGTSQTAVTAASRLAGDINGNGSVDIEDITVLAQQWLGAPVEPCADLDGDDDVNMNDFAIVSADWLDSADAVYKGNQAGTSFDPGTLANSTTYYWRVDEVNCGEPASPWTGDVWSFTTVAGGSAPGAASNPSPTSGAVNVAVNADLSWTAGSGATSHNVYFGTASPGTSRGNQAGTTYDTGTMTAGTVYYWRIDEVNTYGTTTGTVWNFTTMAGLAISNISPSGYAVQYNSLATGQLVYIDRDYTFTNVASLGGSTYIKTANDDKLATATSFLTFTINRDCTVYVAHDDSVSTKPGWMSTFIDTGANLLHNGSVNAFSLYFKDFNVGTVTLGGNAGGSDSSSMYSVVVVPRGIQAGSPNPSNGSTSVNPDANLSWSAGAGATSRNVYFGTVSPGTFRGTQSTTTYDPAMDALTTYYWRIDEIASGVTTTGQVWSFTTSEPIVNIMPLGDSITQGGTHYRYDLWHKLQDNGHNNINFVGSHDVLVGDTYDSQVYDKDHEGHAGWRTDHVLNGGGPPEGGTGNITSWLNGLQATDEVPDIVLMHLGTNDVNGGQSNSSTINEMKAVINILRSYNPNVTILVAKVIPCFIPGTPGMDGLNALIPGLDTYETATSEVIIVDHNTGFLQSWLQADLIHPNATGATEMSNRWYAALVPIL